MCFSCMCVCVCEFQEAYEMHRRCCYMLNIENSCCDFMGKWKLHSVNLHASRMWLVFNQIFEKCLVRVCWKLPSNSNYLIYIPSLCLLPIFTMLSTFFYFSMSLTLCISLFLFLPSTLASSSLFDFFPSLYLFSRQWQRQNDFRFYFSHDLSLPLPPYHAKSEAGFFFSLYPHARNFSFFLLSFLFPSITHKAFIPENTPWWKGGKKKFTKTFFSSIAAAVATVCVCMCFLSAKRSYFFSSSCCLNRKERKLFQQSGKRKRKMINSRLFFFVCVRMCFQLCK